VTGAGRAVSLAGLAAGTYYLRVFGMSGATNPGYTLLIAAPQASSSAAQWDVLLYGDGDQQGSQNRDYDVAHDIQMLEQVQLPPQVNVGVIWGRSPESSWGTNTVEGWLTYDPNSQYGYPSSPLTDSSGNDPDMGDPNTLRDFIIRMVNDRPAAHYALVIKDHGGAWSGAEEDDSSGHIISPAGIATALAAAESQTGKQIDLVAFDTCLTDTVETLYQFRSTTGVIVASEAETYSARQNPDGTWGASTWNLATMVQDLANNPSMSPEAFASTMVADMTPGQTQAMAATRTGAYANLVASLNAFAQAVASSSDPAGDWAAIAQARQQSPWFTDEVSGDQNDRDLGTFMELVAQEAVTSAVRAAAQDVSSKLAAAVIATNPNDGSILGMSTFLPQPGSLSPFDGSYSLSLQNFDLYQGPSGPTAWLGFIQALSQQSASNSTDALNLGPQSSARAKAVPLHALAGSWTVGTYALSPLDQQDWFQFQTLATGGPNDGVTITFPNAQGNLTLELDDASGRTLQTSTTTSGLEQVNLSGQPAGTYFIRVSGAQGNPGYTLTINAPPVATPQKDWTGANNSLAKAYDLGTINSAGDRVIGLTMDAGATNGNRQKWFAVDYAISPRPITGRIELQYAPGSPHNLHLALCDATGKLIQSGTATADSEAVTQNGLTGRCYVLVCGAVNSATIPGFYLQF
jgi:hypothetical protein